MSIPFIEDNDQTRARAEHLKELRRLVGNVYPNKFERSRVTGKEDTITAIVEHEDFQEHIPHVKEGERPAPEALERANAELNKVKNVRISGRISSPPRVMGKAAFVHLSDGVSRLQIYVRKADVKGIHNDDGAPIEEGWELFNLLDHGDFIGVAGYLFVTKTGELSVHVTELQFLAKAMLPMPDKMHGLTDPEIRQRQRYADLIAGSLKVEKSEDGDDSASRELSSREVFERRSKIIRELRRFLDDHGYIEVETPMLTPKATGAAAKPFETYHNALGIKLYSRIAPELYLKRLLVGGFEKVYELNRNFRNEGIDRTHNPEFTMLEFYCAYMDVNGMMDFCEKLLRTTVEKTIGSANVPYKQYGPGLMSDDLVFYNEHTIDFSHPFERLTMKQAITKFWPKSLLSEMNLLGEEFNEKWLDNPRRVREMIEFLDWWSTRGWLSYLRPYMEFPPEAEIERRIRINVAQKWAEIKVTTDINEQFSESQIEQDIASAFEKMWEGHIFLFRDLVRSNLIQPTFITDFPKRLSPLSKASPINPDVAERFELFIAGMECANGFSELNDPEEQYERFKDQVQQREHGDEEAMVMDEDYIRALSYGMPPAAGIGIGIDRLVMLLTNKRSIRDVILFPHMRPERQLEETTEKE